ncbi:MAG: hypothetical protein ACK5KP_04890 [Paludibacteraceae bacterium]
MSKKISVLNNGLDYLGETENTKTAKNDLKELSTNGSIIIALIIQNSGYRI